MKILVTGGAGYVGSVLVPQLLEAGYEVTVYDVLRYGGHSLLPCFRFQSFSFVKGDVGDAQMVKECVSKVDAVIHLAAIVGFPACRKFPAEAERVNVQGTQNVVQALSPQQALVYASTGSNYGQVDTLCSEDSPLNPVSWYGITKTRGEKITMEAAKATALRFATAFGVSPRLRLDLLINDFVRSAVIDRQIIVYERHFRRTFIHVRDMARAVIFAVENIDRMQGQAFNIGHESLNLSKEDVARRIRQRVPFYLHFAEIGSDPDKRDYEVSYQKVRGLGFETVVTLDEGIDELIRAMSVVHVESPYTNL